MPTSTEVLGSLTVPNVGKGDIELTFNPHNIAERAEALRMLSDMQMRGYAILVRQEDGTYERAVSIDFTRGRYILQAPALPEAPARLALDGEVLEAAVSQPPVDAEPLVEPKKRGRPRGRQRRTKDIYTSHAVGVARSAGG